VLLSHCNNAEYMRLGEQTSKSVKTLQYVYIIYGVSYFAVFSNILVTVTNIHTKGVD
jgi:hypothetical protein